MFRSKILLYPRAPKRSILDLGVKAPPLDVLHATPPVKTAHSDPQYFAVPEITGHRSLSNIEEVVSGPVKKYYQITLMRGLIGLPKSTRKVVYALGLSKRHQIVWKPITSSVAGMILKLKELVRVECVSDIAPKKKIPDGYTKIGNAIGSESMLKGIVVIELAGLAPAPFAGMILSDFGATVLRVDKPNASNPDFLTRSVVFHDTRGKQSICIDLKTENGKKLLVQLIEKADVLIDPFRPGVLESWGLDPNLLLKKNPRLIIARLTGYGQYGPLSKMAGHDINYIAISGILSLIGPANAAPTFPVNLLGDFAGGSLFCVIGILLAIISRSKTGKGTVIDAAMIDGVYYLASFIIKMKKYGLMNDFRGTNLLDGGAPFYKLYETKDGKYLAVGCIEPLFYSNFLKGLNLDESSLESRDSKSNWEILTKIFQAKISEKNMSEWVEIFKDLDACVTPVLELSEMKSHPHHKSRSFESQNGGPLPAPRIQNLDHAVSDELLIPGQNSVDISRQVIGLKEEEIFNLLKSKILVQAKL